MQTNRFNKNKKRRLLLYIGGGTLSGMLNGLLGTGGGVAAVSVFKGAGYTQNKSQACSVAFMMGISLVSIIYFVLNGIGINFEASIPIIIGGIPGSLLGAALLNKIKGETLKLIFAVIIIISALRVLL